MSMAKLLESKGKMRDFFRNVFPDKPVYHCSMRDLVEHLRFRIITTFGVFAIAAYLYLTT